VPATHNSGIALSLQLKMEKLYREANKARNIYRQGHYWTEKDFIVLQNAD